MTRAVFYRRNGRLIGFDIKGHSGYAESGSDIVCAAVSTLTELVECTINDQANAGADVTVDSKRAEITLRLPETLCEEKQKICQSVMEAAYKVLSEYAGQYKGYLETAEKIIDGGRNNA